MDMWVVDTVVLTHVNATEPWPPESRHCHHLYIPSDTPHDQGDKWNVPCLELIHWWGLQDPAVPRSAINWCTVVVYVKDGCKNLFRVVRLASGARCTEWGLLEITRNSHKSLGLVIISHLLLGNYSEFSSVTLLILLRQNISFLLRGWRNGGCSVHVQLICNFFPSAGSVIRLCLTVVLCDSVNSSVSGRCEEG